MLKTTKTYQMRSIPFRFASGGTSKDLFQMILFSSELQRKINCNNPITKEDNALNVKPKWP